MTDLVDIGHDIMIAMSLIELIEGAVPPHNSVHQFN
jgi:hypothetical protein